MSPVVTFGVIALGALSLIGLERLHPYEPRQRLLRRGLGLDLFWYAIAQSYVLSIVIALIIAALDQATGWSQHGVISHWPVWGQVLFFLITHDLYIYLFHRLQHHSMLLWRIHEAHHSPHDVDWLSGARSHPLEILINQTIEFAPILLLGAAPEVPAIKGMLDSVWGMYIHSNINVRSGWLQFVLNGPEMHRWHHARELAVPGKNFSTKFAIWDWLLGTAYLPKTKPEDYGLFEQDDAAYPHDGRRLHEWPPWVSAALSPLVAYALQTWYALLPQAQRAARVSPQSTRALGVMAPEMSSFARANTELVAAPSGSGSVVRPAQNRQR